MIKKEGHRNLQHTSTKKRIEKKSRAKKCKQKTATKERNDNYSVRYMTFAVRHTSTF